MGDMSDSKLTRNQTRVFGPKDIGGTTITATVRYDDQCGNGYNTFSITGTMTVGGSGTIHTEIAAAFPELAPLVRFHLVSSDKPLHYIANTLYWLGYDKHCCGGRLNDPPNLGNARRSACWPDMSDELMAPHTYDSQWTEARHVTAREHVTKVLVARLPQLLIEFRAAVESLGFVW